MGSTVTMRPDGVAEGRVLHWQGRSGADYALVGESLDSFAMREADLYIIAKGSHVLWVGSTPDLVADPISRARFRLALDCATQVLCLAGPADRHRAIWDLEGAAPVGRRVAQAA